MSATVTRICQACGLRIPDHHGSHLYCSKTCQRRAKRQRGGRGALRLLESPSCPACGKENAILVHTAVGMVCADCAPYPSCGKLTYCSREAAEWATTMFRLRAEQERGIAALRAYRCPRCGDWHLTSRRVK